MLHKRMFAVLNLKDEGEPKIKETLSFNFNWLQMNMTRLTKKLSQVIRRFQPMLFSNVGSC